MNKRQFLSVFIFIALGLVIWMQLSKLLAFKESYYHKLSYYTDNRDYDVLFFGASRIHNAIDPLQLWDEQGIASYNLSAAGESMPLSYFAVKSALEYHTPKVVVIDGGRALDNDVKTGQAHKCLDAVPFGKVKQEAIDYMVAHDVVEEPLDLMSRMWIHHSRIFELNRYDFELWRGKLKGLDISTSIYKLQRNEAQVGEKVSLEDGEAIRAFDKVMDLCRQKNVKILMTMMPANYSAKRLGMFNSLEAYTEENGFDALDMYAQIDDIGLDYSVDFSNKTHLNLMGAAKVTRFLGDYLADKYGLEDHRQDASYATWHEDRKAAVDDRLQYIGYSDDAMESLMVGADQYLRTELILRDGSIIDSIHGMKEVMDFAGCKYTIDSASLPEDKDACLKVYDLRNQSNGGVPCIERYFVFNDDGFLSETGDEPVGVNYFLEVDGED